MIEKSKHLWILLLENGNVVEEGGWRGSEHDSKKNEREREI